MHTLDSAIENRLNNPENIVERDNKVERVEMMLYSLETSTA